MNPNLDLANQTSP